MSADPYAVDYLGTPVIIKRGYQLCALLTVCQQAASSLENVGDGKYRDKITASLANALELAEELADELHTAVEKARPVRMTGGRRNG
jgi:hypothetical protein